MRSSPGLAASPKPEIVYYNQGAESVSTKSFSFRVLTLALSKSGHAYDLEPSPLGRTSALRAQQAIANGEAMDVAWLGVSKTTDDQLWPIRIPIDRGIQGYRLFLIDGARQAEFSRIKSLNDLKKMTALQGADWPDTSILRSAGLRVNTGSFTHLCHMLMGGRGDYFPRDISEAFAEQARICKPEHGIAVEQTLVLHYTLAGMFYVRKSNKRLHDDIERGFTAAYDDGSYMALYHADAEIQSAIKLARFKTRRVIEIDNPFVSPDAKKIDKRFWLNP